MTLIREPGKFEGEPRYVPHYWGLALEIGSDEEYGDCFVFQIGDEDLELYPDEFELNDYLLLWEDDQGFVHSRLMTQGEYMRQRPN